MEWRIWYTWWIIFYSIYSRLFWIFVKKHGEKNSNLSIRIYINKIEDRIAFRIKTGYYPKLLTPETMKLLGSTKSKITKNENGEKGPNLEILVVLVLVYK